MPDSDIEAFIGSLRFERSMAENTCAAYARDLRLFLKYLKKRGISAAADVKREDIAGFLGEERASGRKSSTRARRLSSTSTKATRAGRKLRIIIPPRPSSPTSAVCLQEASSLAKFSQNTR